MSAEGSKTSNYTLLRLAQDVRDSFRCDCDGTDDGDHTDVGTADCPCGGDECWKCAALMAIANALASAPGTASTPTKEEP